MSDLKKHRQEDSTENDGTFIKQGPGGHPILENPEGEEPEIPVNGPGARTLDSKRDSDDSLFQYNDEGVPIARDPIADSQPRSKDPNSDKGSGNQKKRQGTEDAQRRSDTGTGL